MNVLKPLLIDAGFDDERAVLEFFSSRVPLILNEKILLTELEFYGFDGDPSSHHLKRKQAKKLLKTAHSVIYAYSIFRAVCTNFTVFVKSIDRNVFIFVRAGYLLNNKEHYKPVKLGPSAISEIVGIKPEHTGIRTSEILDLKCLRVRPSSVKVELIRRVGVKDDLKLRLKCSDWRDVYEILRDSKMAR